MFTMHTELIAVVLWIELVLAALALGVVFIRAFGPSRLRRWLVVSTDAVARHVYHQNHHTSV